MCIFGIPRNASDGHFESRNLYFKMSSTRPQCVRARISDFGDFRFLCLCVIVLCAGFSEMAPMGILSEELYTLECPLHVCNVSEIEFRLSEIFGFSCPCVMVFPSGTHYLCLLGVRICFKMMFRTSRMCPRVCVCPRDGFSTSRCGWD